MLRNVLCAKLFSLIQEFACREVHESSGDWILYFTTNSELEKFISTLEMLWAYQNENVSTTFYSKIDGSSKNFCNLYTYCSSV